MMAAQKDGPEFLPLGAVHSSPKIPLKWLVLNLDKPTFDVIDKSHHTSFHIIYVYIICIYYMMMHVYIYIYYTCIQKQIITIIIITENDVDRYGNHHIISYPSKKTNHISPSSSSSSWHPGPPAPVRHGTPDSGAGA
jgi:hypothetical protein